MFFGRSPILPAFDLSDFLAGGRTTSITMSLGTESTGIPLAVCWICGSFLGFQPNGKLIRWAAPCQHLTPYRPSIERWARFLHSMPRQITSDRCSALLRP
ncbi:hypothetical protein D918_00033 [Trichuris suis]|nr:hypothetical protein D918_00033 [Trichuris suis]